MEDSGYHVETCHTRHGDEWKTANFAHTTYMHEPITNILVEKNLPTTMLSDASKY